MLDALVSELTSRSVIRYRQERKFIVKNNISWKMNFQLFNIKLANKVLFQWIILILFYAKICKKIYIYIKLNEKLK